MDGPALVVVFPFVTTLTREHPVIQPGLHRPGQRLAPVVRRGVLPDQRVEHDEPSGEHFLDRQDEDGARAGGFGQSQPLKRTPQAAKG